jgi:hypothetical protein
LVASLETILNLEAIDKIDPKKRVSPPNRELVAQGVGNLVSGLVGGLPVTSVIVRGSVNVNAGAKTKVATIVHGSLLLLFVALLYLAVTSGRHVMLFGIGAAPLIAWTVAAAESRLWRRRSPVASSTDDAAARSVINRGAAAVVAVASLRSIGRLWMRISK